MKSFVVSIPLPVSLAVLTKALEEAQLPATVATLGRRAGADGVKLTPGKGIDRQAVQTFVKGFVAGFNA